jgi:uncharacterized C2H2 Zn-finger protein
MSIAATFFSTTPDRDAAGAAISVFRCNHCLTVYRIRKNGGTGTLRGHVNRAHHALFEAWVQAARIAPPAIAAAAAASAAASRDVVDDDSDVQSVPSTPRKRTSSAYIGSGSSASVQSSSKSRTRTISTMYAPLHSAALPAAIARCFATNHIAYNVASSPSFLALIDTARGCTDPMPQRKAVKTAIQLSARAMRARLLQRLVDSKATVAIAIDGWTNIRQGKVTNVVLLCNGAAYYWCSIANSTQRNDAAWMEGVLQPVIEQVRTHDVEATTRRPRGDHEATSRLQPRGDHAAAMRPPRGDHVATTRQPRGDHRATTRQPRVDHEAVCVALTCARDRDCLVSRVCS